MIGRLTHFVNRAVFFGRKSGSKLCTIILSLALTMTATAAELTMPSIFSDHMVLQREQPIKLWGSAGSGEAIDVLFLDKKFSTRADPLGHWTVTLPSMEAGGPFELVVQSREQEKIFTDVYLGEVWLAAGQSNMAFRFQFADDEDKKHGLQSLGDVNVRMFEVPKIVAGGKLLSQAETPWAIASKENIDNASAVAVFFSQALHLEPGVAVGVINCSQGSSTIQAWMSDEAIERAISKGYVSAPAFDDIRKHYRNPEVLHRTMLSKVVPFGIKGVLWYQGESNGDDAASYKILLPELITSWREMWGQRALPFLFAQLPAYEPPNDAAGDSWTQFRAAQAEVDRSVPGTGMVVLIDLGEKDNIHPTDKKTVGDRFANLARAQVYGEKIAYSGPSLKKIRYRGDSAVLTFYQAEGLNVKGDSVKGFSVMGDDGVWYAANAERVGEKIIVRHPEVQEILGVRYGWANAPDINLYNKYDYPAVPFNIERKVGEGE